MRGRLKDIIRAHRRPQLLACAICIYAPTSGDVVEDAVTVLGGIAVCIDHLGYISDETLMLAVATVKKRERQ